MAALKFFDFNFARSQFSEHLSAAVEKESLDDLEKIYNTLVGSDEEKKSTVDQVFKDMLNQYVTENSDTNRYRKLIDTTVAAVKKELCSSSIPFHLLVDIFDSITLQQCDEVFKLVEENVAVWKSEAFYNAGKNYLLRMCNDIVRRLSKSQNTVFCGRIQLFLATLFPLSEKSGLNLVSQFHLENVTLYNTKSDDVDSIKIKKECTDEAMEEGEMQETSGPVPIDYNLYRKFWQLQDFFRRPVQCYEKVAWKTFVNYSDEVLRCFASVKLDDLGPSKKCTPAKESAKDNYFAKFLTSEKLLDLQLSDSTFRRYVLVQFLITFQYLNATVKFKTSTQVLTEEQAHWMKQTTETVYTILRETPPDGALFAKNIEHILTREENWNSWKNDRCPSYVREPTTSSKAHCSRVKKRTFGDDLKASGGKVIKMGNSELTRLWNICPDNMQACRKQEQQRNFLPSLEEYFEEAIDQLDPEAMIDDKFKLVNNKSYAWKGLRLLACHSPDFFAQQSQTTGQSLSRYLTDMLGKLAKTMPAQSEEINEDVAATKTEDVANSEEDDEDTNGGGGTGEERNSAEMDEEEEEEEEERMVTREELEGVAAKMATTWEQLAGELNVEGECEPLAMLCRWQDQEGERATVAALQFALHEIGQSGVVTSVFGTDGTKTES